MRKNLRIRRDAKKKAEKNAKNGCNSAAKKPLNEETFKYSAALTSDKEGDDGKTR